MDSRRFWAWVVSTTISLFVFPITELPVTRAFFGKAFGILYGMKVLYKIKSGLFMGSVYGCNSPHPEIRTSAAVCTALHLILINCPCFPPQIRLLCFSKLLRTWLASAACSAPVICNPVRHSVRTHTAIWADSYQESFRHENSLSWLKKLPERNAADFTEFSTKHGEEGAGWISLAWRKKTG